ncbi:MAG: ANTAR domain-containing protein [Betaproteobacteria bacterium]|nr:ANTAR domain-containing protein [Betaproteobacteria bacterium]
MDRAKADDKTDGRLRVLLIDRSAERAAVLDQALQLAGYVVAAILTGSSNLYNEVKRIEPDAIIIDLDSPDRDTLEQMREIAQDRPKPVVMFAQDDDGDTIRQAVRAGVSAYVVDGLAASRIKPLLEVAIAHFSEYQALREELEHARSTLVERKIIEKAKGVLMHRKGMREDEAYKTMRKMAMDQGKRLLEVAQSILAVADLLI